MLRLVNNFSKTLQISPEPLSTLQCVRWRRKPRWLPTAKSKVFQVPERPKVSEIEAEEMKRLYNNYRTSIKSIRRYLTMQYEMASRQTVDPELLKKAFDDDFAASNAINDKWNTSNALIREARYQEELNRDLEIAKETKVYRQQMLEKKYEESEEIVREFKAASHTFITRENIDEAIEKAISTEVDYNFAIKTDGSKIIGRETSAKTEKPVEKIGVKQ